MSSSVVFLGAYRTAPERLLMLVRRTATDDRGAFTRLYDALVPQVSQIVHGLVGDPARAEAVTAAAFVEAWHSADAHTEGGTDVAAWITGIAARLAQEPPAVRHPSIPGGAAAGPTLGMLLDRRSGARGTGGSRGPG